MELFDHSEKDIEQLLAEDDYTPDELATLLGMSVNVIHDACHEGDLKSTIVNHDIVNITRNDALAWLRAR